MTADHENAQGHSSASSPNRRLVVGCGYLGTRVARRWLAAEQVDNAYTHISAQGVAAHKACDTQLQHKLENVAQLLWEARKHVTTAVNRATSLEGESK